MKKCHLKVMLFIKILNLVQSEHITSEQVGCVEGPVLPGLPQPKLNIRILPLLSVRSFSTLNIVCDASAARKINGCLKLPKPPLPPTRILINIGVYLVKECISPTNINQCTCNLTAFFQGIPPRISCTAFDAIGECRFKIVNVSLVEEATLQRISRKETSKRNTKDYSIVIPKHQFC
ncbi:uncharacterized protein LOC124454578 [Xenia sp. Carnegie-2017]|uniref:uncharacterized protein LOC124454578 n=1 Tax=Xenia sp. Carnegie-2017 TaxID=2897299 RepID=UPI001F04C1DB|nr:uncharacterized protein LOC124454578 [Xenia sp. Carnegie-2017]